MPAKTIPVTDLASAVDAALLRAIGKGRPGGPIIVGRVIKEFEGNPLSAAKKVVSEISPKLQGLKATPTAIPGKGGTTIGFVIRPKVEK
jgi:hypothetical protein